MATRFGGRYSPQPRDGSSAATAQTSAAAPPPASRPVRTGVRPWLLFVLPLALIPRAFLLDAGGLVLTLAGLALMLLSAWLTREGVRAQLEFDRRSVARRPAFPRKLVGAVAMGLGMLAAALPDAGPVGGGLLGLLGAALHVAAFGLDPLRDKGMEGIDTYQQDRASRTVSQAENYLKGMAEAIARVNDRALARRVETFQSTARTMFLRVEEDPRDLTSARKYLTVYLMGARDATVKFADLYGRSRDPKARADYEALLRDLEASFTRENDALLSDNRDDLDIEVSVLRERLEREGIVAAPPPPDPNGT